MATLIDSSVLIAAERGHLNFDDLTSRYAEDDLAISAVTASELLHGLHRTRTAAQRQRRQAFVEALLAQLPVIAFDLAVARIHAALWADLAKSGVAVGERDLMIGATAIARIMPWPRATSGASQRYRDSRWSVCDLNDNEQSRRNALAERLTRSATAKRKYEYFRSWQ